MSLCTFLTLTTALITMILGGPVGASWLVYGATSRSSLTLGLLVDTPGVMFSVTVLTVAGGILLYCRYYMAHETHGSRFRIVLLAFVARILILVASSSPPSLILGWDGLGLSSYFLVAYYQHSSGKYSRAVTVYSNRVGDAFMLLSFGVIISLGLNKITYGAGGVEIGGVLSSCLILALITKSAIFPWAT